MDKAVSDNRFISRKKKTLYNLSLLAFAGIFFYTVLNFFLGDYQAAAIELVVTLLILLSIWNLKSRQNLNAAIDIGLLCGLIVFVQNFYSGGFEGTGVYWVFIAPLFFSSLAGSKKGFRWSLYLQLAMLGLYILSLLGAFDLEYGGFVVFMIFIVINSFLFITYGYQKNIEEFQAEILENEEDIKEEDKQRREFIKIVSDRIRTPINTLRWNLELLKDGNYKITKEAMKFINESYIVTLEAIERINILTLAVDENISKVRLDKSEFDIGKLLNKIIKDDFITNEVKKRKLKLKKSIPQKTINILADKSKIEIALKTVIHNAAIYNKDKGEINITLKAKTKDKIITLLIEDTGIGVKQEELKKIFEPFFRGSNASSVSTSNNGVSLYIAKQYIEKNKGTIAIKSRINKGTVVTITFPAVQLSLNTNLSTKVKA